ncbi:IncQ-type mobilization protein MobB [Providencia rettgeri]|uniref:IncQ-type mobilization protein MobB n=1 Tax=Providencia rettgeri TaxID=587 RepID=UPI001F51551B|nr:IncQ-type mobilization protein MobB [Providencia rettgeri]
MNAIDRVKKSRGINELAEQIEPLAQSMATLADEARQVMSQTQQASEAQAAEWLKAQRQTGAAWVELAKELREVQGRHHRPDDEPGMVSRRSAPEHAMAQADECPGQ